MVEKLHQSPKQVRKLSLEERTATPELRELLEGLNNDARDIEKRLFAAYPVARGRERQEASERVLEDLIALGNRARGLSVQYRDFRVGAVMVAMRTNPKFGENPWIVRFNANTKPTEHDKKWCAELYLMDEAEAPESDINSILSFVVVATPQMDDDSKVNQITLTPCKLCRDRMKTMSRGEGSLVSPDTEVITADARDTRYRKFQKVKDLPAFHKETDLEID
jgi:cytidine deaminase